ncbi:MAG: glycoside hydrolase family 130 protein [Kiritimatiellia bacterium]|nr:glycoside hydrolase family 130 protein [Kiritimatiellia bacterium]
MITKYKKNPIVKPSDVKPSLEGYQVKGAFNPGATVYNDEVLLLIRTAENCEPREGYVRLPVYRFKNGHSYPDILEFRRDARDLTLKDTRGVVYKGKNYLSTLSHIRIARSRDGFNFKVDDQPFIYPTDITEEYGCEDARITQVDGRYYINYTAISQDSWATKLAVTDDFKTVKRLGFIFHPENKDVAIFPEKIGGMYHALHRPNNSGFGRASIWYAESPDLLHWGNHQCIVRPLDTKWEAMKIGGGAPPIKTKEGWLIIAHGKGEGSRYSLFLILLDLQTPWKVIKRAAQPLLAPTEKYETEGFFGNVIFSNGVVEKDGKLLVYYGAADEFSCVAVTDVESLLNSF